jgi:hypothetical protein
MEALTFVIIALLAIAALVAFDLLAAHLASTLADRSATTTHDARL